MTRCILLSAFLFFSGHVFTQQTPLLYSRAKADTIFNLIRTQSMYRNTVDWDTISRQFYHRIDTATSSPSQFMAFRWLFRQLNDFHSQVTFQDQTYAWYKEMPDGREAELTRTYGLLQPRFGIMEARIINNYGYICIPGYYGHDAGSVSNTIKKWRDTICTNINRPVKGWIIDVRANMGGSMYPMIAALSFLIGDIKFAGASVTGSHAKQWWSLNKGDVYFNTYANTASGPHCMAEQINAPVAVLTSFYTLSSGEMVVTAFKQRPHTIQIGDTTGGLVTNNQWLMIGKDATLNLSNGYYTDRKGKEYQSGLVPDMAIKAEENFSDLLNDKKIQAALKWLNKQH